MRATERHREAEERFRGLLIGADLPAPDGVTYEPESVGFYRHEQKLVVSVDFEGEGAARSGVAANAWRLYLAYRGEGATRGPLAR